ncbi:UMP-CMP kinase-like [Mytilus trossulus]|uniref:UMP-CMP kinase-like n=1 Tax=Mytilus trossulus TaxID=6551 RepID=UPI003004D5B0
MAKYNVMFVLGGPGAGKGTQCEKIVKEYGYVHLSAGDLLRQERNRQGSQFGEEIQSHIKNGTIVPVEITCSLLRRAMETSEGKDTFLIDGFPRNQDNLEGWKKAMDEISVVKMVLFFNCSEEVCIQRCLSRGQTSGRADDNMESLKKRIHTYSNSTLPIIEYYRKLNLLKEISADKSTDEVFEEVKKALATISS